MDKKTAILLTCGVICLIGGVLIMSTGIHLSLEKQINKPDLLQSTVCAQMRQAEQLGNRIDHYTAAYGPMVLEQMPVMEGLGLTDEELITVFSPCYLNQTK